MILVLTGFHPVPFDRLISAMDEIAGRIEEEVVIQRGESKIEIKNSRSMKYAGFKNNEDLVKSARIVVSHAGVGTILDCRQLDRQLIIVPRKMELGESHDNHQLEIARAVSESKSVITVEDVSELQRTMESIRGTSIHTSNEGRHRIVMALKRTIEEIAAATLE